MRSDTGQCLGVQQILLHCTELVLYANAKLTCKELAGLGRGMRPQLRLVEKWVGLILERVCSGEWPNGGFLRCYVSCRGNKVICERCQWSMDSMSLCMCEHSAVNYKCTLQRYYHCQ